MARPWLRAQREQFGIRYVPVCAAEILGARHVGMFTMFAFLVSLVSAPSEDGAAASDLGTAASRYGAGPALPDLAKLCA